jgi:putative ABC transport system permease protein
MIKNYILIAVRNLVRQPIFSFINIFGLALGIACSMVIILFVYGELSYDTHYADSTRIYRVATSFFNIGTFANGPHHLPEALEDYGGDEVTTRVEKNNDVLISRDHTAPSTELAYEVDSTFFSLFTYDFISGNPLTCLIQPNSVVITESVSRKYFSNTNTLGEILLVGKERVPFIITGIVKETTLKSHLTAEIWFPFVANRPSDGNWNSAYTYNYVKVKEGVTQANLEAHITQLIREKVYPTNHTPGQSYEEWVLTDNAYKLFVQPLESIYLHSKYRSELSPGGNENNIYTFSGVAILVLVLAMVNFLNLSTARASRRAKEVGLRKTMGTTRGALVEQFLIESVLTCLFALIISLVLAELFLSGYRLVIGQELIPSIFINSNALLAVTLFTCLVGLLAGLYPAFYLTSFQPASVLKGKLSLHGKSTSRNGLVVVQFSISISLVICMITIIKQQDYLQTKDLGFDRENILVIQNADELKGNLTLFRNELEQESDVVSTSLSSRTPASTSFWLYTYQTNGMSDAVTYNTIPADEKYLTTFGMTLLQGRNFDPRTDTDTTVAILNESAVNDLMLENPVGMEINKGQKIIGIVSDFHYQAVQQKIEPMVMIYRKEGHSMAVKISGNPAAVIKTIEDKWKKLSPDEGIRYSFIDDSFTLLLQKEQAFTKIIIFFSVLSIFICCLGLFGLTLYATEQRLKEIGIRKVLGASINSILILFSKNFSMPILVSIAVSIPVSLYFMRQWLDGFAYQTEVSWSIFLLAALGMIILSLLTVIVSSWRAAVRNPVEILQGE